MSAKGIFHAYGLFWRRDEVDWNPGSGNLTFKLLGHRGKIHPKLRIANFREQKGIYILYGDLGPYYVGLTRDRRLGNRLKDHVFDHHKKKWDRFSWFSFGRVLETTGADGLQKFAPLPLKQALDSDSVIGDVEAVLIRAMALQNVSKMKFAQAEEWKQVPKGQVSDYLNRLRR